MIQRKQSLFLLSVAIIAIVTLFIPFIGFNKSSEPFTINMIEGINSIGISSNIYYPFILTLLTVIISIVTIFLFKNRVLQYKLANILILLNVFTIGLFFLLDYINVPHDEIHFLIGAFIPLIGALFSFLAAHFIKKDEQLVRSTDRIR